MPAPGGVRVDFLKEDKIGVKGERGLCCAIHTLQDAFFGAGAALFSAVHEKSEIRGVGAEAYIVGDRSIFAAGPGGFLRLSLYLQFDIVLDPAVCQKNEGNIGDDRQQGDDE